MTPRDQRIISVLADHHVLTTEQLAAMFFTSLSRAHERLLVLHRLGVLDRFRRVMRYGSSPYKWTLAHLGARLHAAVTGAPAPTAATVADRALRLSVSPKLPHLLAGNDFFVRLHTVLRATPEAGVAEWWNEEDSARACGMLVRPDGRASVRHPAGSVSFWYEHDTGSEPLTQLRAKVERYARIIHAEMRLPVLIELPSQVREDNLHQVLGARPPVAVATTYRQIAVDPMRVVWRVPGRLHRVGLLQVG
ncbi:hypothetical protein Afil01_31380 [Actinorhabdospora filicis]|uniref:Replication-relaxation n=1 Tax=Actinorhabdospora filicis TaxID=1785913 RepID=A0A9W6SM41_9ACTN|nr:replication-relaxation family protein [Actinorhabdospora filicis]GLZ78331.1 hypothetical protein Afil01_31380 [Actinorhabdospora filicis]